MKHKLKEIDGALLVDKPAGITSAAVVGGIKRRFGLSRIGHAGTLDPLATGLLVLLCGKATRLQSLFLESVKEYAGVIRLGLSTDTDDLEGEVVACDEHPEYIARLSMEQVIALVRRELSGTQRQIPPQYSAIKIGGKRCYEMARAGQEVEPQARTVEIEWQELELLSPQRLRYRVRCSKGTYIRSLARDTGRVLGTYGCLESIRRLASEPFTVDDALPLEELLNEDLATSLIGIEQLVSHVPSVTLSELDCRSLRNGVQGPLQRIDAQEGLVTAKIAVVFTPDKRLCGLIERGFLKEESSDWHIKAIL